MTYTYQVPVSYTVNVSLAQTPSGLSGYNTNSIAIFSNETSNSIEPYIRALSPSTVKTAYGSDSLTYKMAQALFTPVPNFTSGRGELYIFPLAGTNATNGKIAFAGLNARIDNFKAVTNGSIDLTIDGVLTKLRGLDFTNINSLTDIAAVILNQNPDVFIKNTSTDMIIYSKRPGGTVTMTALDPVVGTDLSGANFFDITNAETLSGQTCTGQSLSSAVETALEQVYFGGVLTTQYQDDATLLANAAAIQSLDCIYYNELASLGDITVTGTANKTAGNSQTRLLAYSKGEPVLATTTNMSNDASKVAIATYASIAQSVNFSASNTANTLNLKTLTGVLPDGGLNDTYVLNARDNGVDIYGQTGGLAVVYSNNNNGYTDDVVATLRLKKDVQVGGFNYLRQTNTKIPQTEQAMTGLKNAYGLVCEKFVKNGVITPGTWNGAIPFGDPEAFTRNIAEKGYYIYSIPISQQPQTEREARIAPVAQIAIKLSGAFHFSDVLINVQQ